MHFTRLLTCVVAIGSMLTLGSQALAGDLTVDSWQLESGAHKGRENETRTDSNTTVSNPFIGTTDARLTRGYSTTDYDFAWDASGGSFAVEMDHLRNYSAGSWAESVGSIHFTVTGDAMSYDLSGMYTLHGAYIMYGAVGLYKDGDPVPVFEWVQKNNGRSPVTFTVGQTGDGGVIDRMTGSPTGTLVPGHSYELRYEFSIYLGWGAFDANASGSFLMTLTRITPEELTVNLVEDVIVLNLNNGINNALDSKLDAVMAALEDTNENNDQAACNALEAFINSTLAQSGNHIPEADADALIEAAQLIIDVLCSS